MKKIILLPMLLASFGLARQVIVDNHTFVNVDEVNPIAESNGIQQTDYSTLKLSLNIHNSENRTKKIRIAGKFSGLDAQKKYYISGCDENKVPGIKAMVNFYESSRIGQHVLDVMLDVPQGDKNLCIAFRENNWSPVVKGTVSIDWKGSADGVLPDYVTGSSPIDNKVAYNYVDKRLKRDLNEYQQPKKLVSNEVFFAQTLYDRDAPELLGQNVGSMNLNLKYSKYIRAKSLVDLHVGSFGAYKDTRMLMPNMGSMVDYYGWNESTFDGHVSRFTEAEERIDYMGRCWAISAFNLYSYFAGNRNAVENAVTQDEMVFIGEKYRSTGLDVYDAFNSKGNSPGAVAEIINSVMHNANAQVRGIKSQPLGGPEIYDYIKESVNGFGKPLPFDIPEHFMLIDGLALTDDENQDTLVHLINLDNFGNEAYVYLSSLKKAIKNYITYDMPTDFAVSNELYPVDADSDGDGVVDFDEYYRFGVDSDLDKVYSSALCYALTGTEFNCDEKDKLLENITLYALEYLSVNDNVSCYGIEGLSGDNPWLGSSSGSGCHIASESTFETNAVNLGVNSFVGSVYSKGGVLVRNRAKLSNAVLYNLDKNIYKVNYQNNPDADVPFTYVDPEKWPFVVDKKLESISSKINNGHKIIRNGETFTISGEPDHNGFSFLKVESGGTLVIGAGEMYIGDLQIESGSMFKFEHPTYKSELHLNGNFIWRGTYVEYEQENGYVRENLDYATARGFKLFQHSPREMYIDSDWHGTIVAPYSKIVLGQASTAKKIYGQVMGRHVVVHQRSKVYDVPYDPVIPSLAKNAADQAETEKEVSAVIPSSVKITGASRNTINFTTTTPGQFLISVVKLDGSVVASFMVDRDVAGAGSVDWNSENVPNGAYMLSVKHNGKSSGKMISLK